MPSNTSNIKNNCLNCGEELHKATSVEHDIGPHDGAIAICSQCGHVMAFDAQSNFRELTDEEIKDVAGSKDLLMAQKMGEFIRHEEEIKKEILPIFKELIAHMELHARQEMVPFGTNEYGWFVRDGNNPDSEIGFGDTEQEAAKDFLTETLRRLVDDTRKRKRRN